MDGYLYNRDPYRQASAGYYASYGLERQSSFGLPLSDSIASYARIPLDPYSSSSGYGAPPSYQPQVVLRPRYASPPPDPPAFRSQSRPRSRPSGPKKKHPPPPPQNLGPRKKPFKQTQKVRFSEENGRPSTKPLTQQTQTVGFEKNGRSLQNSVQMKPLQAGKRVDKLDARTGKAPRSQASSLVKETQELHSLYRTGIDSQTDKKKDDRKAASMKRKAETQMQKSTPVKEVYESAKKKQKHKKNKQFAKDKKGEKQADPSPVAEKVAKSGRPSLTEEEMKEAEAALELQRGMSKRIREFLGVSPVVEKLESKEVVDVSETDAKPEDSKEAEKPSELIEDKDSKEAEKSSKREEPQRSPEEEQQLEEESFKFFCKLFEEHQDLRNLYIEKCNSGLFECLVCHSIDAERSKKFWNLVSLVMHTSMRKKMRPEHRGYGRAVSAVLGWDPNKTPNVPRGSKHIPTVDKTTNQVKEDTKPETEEKMVDKEEKVDDVNVSAEHQEENAEDTSKDCIEE